MRVPVKWLAEFLDLPVRDADELERILVSLGHEVEGIEHFGPSFEGVVVGLVEEVGPHPDASRIRFCRVNDGSATHDVVCGAWNFGPGAVIAYARVGSRLGIDTDHPATIGAREIRGVTSHGMIASARELGLGDDHEGIMVLDELGAADLDDVGRPLEEVLSLSDVVLDVSITPNRGDCMSIRGLARELAAYWQIPVKEVSPRLATSAGPTDFDVSIVDPEACPRFVAHRIDGVTMGLSPLWMQTRLLSIGQRPISNVVDVSNYVMWELGQPIHTFDAEKIADRHIIVRRAGEGETLRTLDEATRVLEPGDILVTDPSGPIALAGIMGGASTEVSAETTSVLVEAANWEPASILFTSQRLGLRSEASGRFERGVDPDLPGLAAARTVELISLTAGGVPRVEAVDNYPVPARPRQVAVGSGDLSRLLGSESSFEESLELLRRLGFGVDGENGEATVTVPTYRSDVTRPADLAEEVARLHGFDRFPDLIRYGKYGMLTAAQSATRRLEAVLVGAGLTEAQTLSFVGQADLDTLRLPRDDPRRKGIRVKNPLREEEAILRTTLLPGLLAALARNVARGNKEVRLFEKGRVFHSVPDSDDPRIPHQPVHLGVAMVGGDTDAFSATGLLALLSRVTGSELAVVQDRLPMLHPGRGGTITDGVDQIGIVGEIHPSLGRAYGLDGRVAVAEMALDTLISVPSAWRLDEVSPYPPLVFDVAFVVPESVPAGRLMGVVELAAGEDLETLELFDEFRGGSIPDGHRSLAVRVTLRAMDRTLSDREAGPILRRIAGAVEERVGGVLRGRA